MLNGPFQVLQAVTAVIMHVALVTVLIMHVALVTVLITLAIVKEIAHV